MKNTVINTTVKITVFGTSKAFLLEFTVVILCFKVGSFFTIFTACQQKLDIVCFTVAVFLLNLLSY